MIQLAEHQVAPWKEGMGNTPYVGEKSWCGLNVANAQHQTAPWKEGDERVHYLVCVGLHKLEAQLEVRCRGYKKLAINCIKCIMSSCVPITP